jgi:hypothetical protein
MVSIKCKCPYVDATWVPVHSCEITVQQIWRLLRKTNPLLSSKRRPHFNTYKWSSNEHILGHGSQRGPKPRTTMLARASRNILDLGGQHLSRVRSQAVELHDSQGRETVKYGHESRGTWKQEWLCWRGPAAIYPTDRSLESLELHC